MLKSFTTEMIFASQMPEKQIEIVKTWFEQRGNDNADIKKAFDDVLHSRTYAIAVLYVLLSDK
jgi:hypothetical protein